MGKIIVQEYVSVERYGYSTVEKPSFVTVEDDGQIIINGVKVKMDEVDKEFILNHYQITGEVPKWYCVRNPNGGFVCGLDLLHPDEGVIWVNGKYLSNPDLMMDVAFNSLNSLRREGINPSDLIITLEEAQKM